MNPPKARDPHRFRLTTSVLMVWVMAVAVGLGFLKGDVAEWLSPDAVVVLFLVTLLALVVGVPWLAVLAERSTDPAVTKPLTSRERQAENLLTVGCLGLMTAALAIFGLLAYTAFTAGR